MLPIPFDNPDTYPGHSGVDFGQSRGTPFRASGPGVVTVLGWTPRGGYTIWVRYDAGCEVGYVHMDSHEGCPPEGTRVIEGSQLGYVGNSGNSTGPHLHAEVEGYASTAGFWQWFTPDRVVGHAVPSKDPAPTTPSPTAAHHLIGEEMLIADMPNGSFLIVPQGNGKPRAVVLDGGSGADRSGLPRLKFETAGSIGMLTAAVIF